MPSWDVPAIVQLEDVCREMRFCALEFTPDEISWNFLSFFLDFVYLLLCRFRRHEASWDRASILPHPNQPWLVKSPEREEGRREKGEGGTTSRPRPTHTPWHMRQIHDNQPMRPALLTTDPDTFPPGPVRF